MPSSANPNIKHVFVLMLENRSFDHMLGFLNYQGIDLEGKPASIDRVTLAFTNNYKGHSFQAKSPADNIMVEDPGHEFGDVVEQLCGPGKTYQGGPYPPVNNTGFVQNFGGKVDKDPSPTTYNPAVEDVMRCYDTSRQLPVLSQLAQQFAVCDRWFSSMPGPTWPNRFFVHTASSAGLDDSPRGIDVIFHQLFAGYKFQNGTIFDRISGKFGKEAWRIYRGRKKPKIGSIPCAAALKGVRLKDTHPFENFKSDLNKDYGVAYTFIEPNYGDYILNHFSGGQSQHPRDNVQNGEALIKEVYETIRQSPVWLNSLLIVAYDEHGGFCDHVLPPAGVPPGDDQQLNKHGFAFDQLGVRVPGLVISAYTPKGLISHETYDHASIPATLEAIFGLAPMTARDAAANNVTALAALAAARTDTPEHLEGTPEHQAMALAPPDPVLEAVTPVDGGNLPGFLHIVQKADAEEQMEREVGQPTEMALIGNLAVAAPFARAFDNRAQARAYMESTLTRLLGVE
jgi:phospholipase C